MPRRIALISFLSILWLISPAQFRKYSNEFLNIGAGARGLAMGGAQIAISQDGTSGYWNPAGLVWSGKVPDLNLMHADYFAGIAKYDFASLSLPLKESDRFLGVSLLRFAVDDIPNTLFLVEPDGSINYNNVSSFSSADYAFLLSYAQPLRKDDAVRISFGANAKIIHRKVGSFARSWGFGLDAGLQMHARKLHLGLMLKDVSTTYNSWIFSFTDKEKEVFYLTNNDIPVRSTELTAPRASLSGAYEFTLGTHLVLMPIMDVELSFDGRRNTLLSSNGLNADPKLGLEATYRKQFFLRAGVSNFQKALEDSDTLNQNKVWIFQPSIGAGFKINNVTIDYAFSNLANQSNPLFTHVFSLRLNLVKKEGNKP
jgi:hypothetical protein